MEKRSTEKSSGIESEMWAEKLTLEQARYVYETWLKVDFPPEEIKPFSLIEEMWERGCYQAYGFYERAPKTENDQTDQSESVDVSGQAKEEGQTDSSAELCAYAFLLGNKEERVLLLDYFAVCRQKRGAGYGSRALPLLMEECEHWSTMLIEVEDDELKTIDDETRTTRKRRISFYANAGCLMTSVRSRVWGVDYRIMIVPRPDRIAGERIAEKVTALYGSMYNAEMMKKHFAITGV